MARTVEMTPEQAALVCLLAKEVKPIAASMEPCRSVQTNVMFSLEGMVSKGANGMTTKSNAPKAKEVIAWLLEQLNPQGRAAIMDKFAAATKETRVLPEASESCKNSAAMIVSTLTSRESKPRAGSLTGSVRVSEVNLSRLGANIRSRVAEVSREIDLDFDEEGEE